MEVKIKQLTEMTPGNPSWSVHFKSVATTMILQFSSDDQIFLNMFSAYV